MRQLIPLWVPLFRRATIRSGAGVDEYPFLNRVGERGHSRGIDSRDAKRKYSTNPHAASG
jgi:hypothetical protein